MSGAFAAPTQEHSPKKKEVTILPLITIYDVDKDSTYNWWSETDTASADAQKLSAQLMHYLGKENGKVIHFMDPYKNTVKFRENLQKTVLSTADMLAISKSLNTEVLMVGDLIIEKSAVIPAGQRLKVRLELLRAPLFNKVGEVHRVVDLYAVDYARFLETGGELWTDVRAAVEKRIEDYRPTESQRLELIVNGTFDHNQLEILQRYLKNHISKIRNIAQSYQERDTLGMFVEYDGGGEELGRELREARLEGFMTQVVSSSKSQVIFDVRPQSAVK